MLTDSKIRQLRPNGKIQKVSDGGGLYVQVAATGTKSWRLGYRFDGKQKTYTIGTYPEVSLAEARRAREELKHLLAQGVDPSAKKDSDGDAGTPAGMTFEAVALEWFEKKKGEFKPSHAEKVMLRFRKHLFPYIGAKPIAELRPRDIIQAARVAEASGHAYSARLIASMAERVCSYAQVCEYCETNVGAGYFPRMRG